MALHCGLAEEGRFQKRIMKVEAATQRGGLQAKPLRRYPGLTPTPAQRRIFVNIINSTFLLI